MADYASRLIRPTGSVEAMADLAGIDQVHWFAVAGMHAVPVVAVEGKAGIALGAGFLPASGLGGVGRNYRVDVSWST